MTTDGPAALRLMLDKLIQIELNAEWDKADKLVSVWQAERQAYQSAIEEADRLRFAAEAQADADRAALALARSALSEIEREARNQITAPDTNAAQMVVSEAVAETCRRIAAALEGGAR